MVHKFNPENKKKLDSPERRKLLPPEETLRRLGLETGNVMADIGCGIGYFTLPAARIVGSQGKIYGLDIMAESRMKLHICLTSMVNNLIIITDLLRLYYLLIRI